MAPMIGAVACCALGWRQGAERAEGRTPTATRNRACDTFLQKLKVQSVNQHVQNTLGVHIFSNRRRPQKPGGAVARRVACFGDHNNNEVLIRVCVSALTTSLKARTCLPHEQFHRKQLWLGWQLLMVTAE